MKAKDMQSTDDRLAKIENALDLALGRLVTADIGYTEGERRQLQEALEAVRSMRREQ